MKNNFYLLLLFCCWNGLCLAQTVPNYAFSNTSEKPCAFDNTTILLQIDDWLIYQTLNDEWNGVIDSSRCIGITPNGNSWTIDLTQIDAAKALFVKSLMDDDSKILLETNQLYSVQGFTLLSPNPPLNISGDCPNNLCSGIIVGIEIPNEDTTGTNLRTYLASFNGDGFWNAASCLPTEKFDENYLRELVFKFTFDSTDLANVSLKPDAAYFELVWDMAQINEDVVAPASSYNEDDSTFYVGLWDLTPNNWSSNYLVIHTDTTYPSSSNISYKDIGVALNEEEAQNIEVTVSEWMTLIFQPFTNFRGALVANSDSIRHQLSLIIDGGNMCLQTIIDLNFGPWQNFVYKGGDVHFSGGSSCMQFMLGGKLIVSDNATFYYGNHGIGMLALRQGGSIVLGKNSTLVIDNNVFMHEVKTTSPQQIYMELNPGSSLLFGKHAHLSNRYSIDKKMKLNIYMNGGVLDDSNLSAEERALINKIYPEEPAAPVDHSLLFPNPATSYTSWVYHAPENTEAQLTIYNSNGLLLKQWQQELHKGPNEIPIDIRSLAPGMYNLKWNTITESGVKKWVKQ